MREPRPPFQQCLKVLKVDVMLLKEKHVLANKDMCDRLPYPEWRQSLWKEKGKTGETLF